jgi:hypothetical protein
MLSLLLVLAWLAPPQAAPPLPIDVTRIEVGAPMVVAEIDTGKLKGEVRRLCWSPDGASLYIQTAEAEPPVERFRHYSVTLEGGALTPLDRAPDWAATYWAVKQDRTAPGLESLVIEVQQGTESIKTGTGPAGVLDRSSSPDRVAMGSPSVDGLASANMGNDKARVVRLTLLGTDIATWTNERPYPGARFSWGPSRAGALVYVGEKGQLVFLDQNKQKRPVAATKDAVLPAWSTDGKRLAFLQKTGRKKYALTWAPVSW